MLLPSFKLLLFYLSITLLLFAEAETQSVFETIEAKLKYEDQHFYNNFIAGNTYTELRKLSESLSDSQDNMNSNELSRILTDHRKEVNQIIDKSLNFDTRFFTDWSILRLHTKVEEDLHVISKLLQAQPPDQNAIEDMEKELDNTLNQRCLFSCIVAGWATRMLIGNGLSGAVAVFSENVLLPESNWLPNTSNFFQDREDWENTFRLELASNQTASYLVATDVNNMFMGVNTIFNGTHYYGEDPNLSPLFPKILEDAKGRLMELYLSYQEMIQMMYQGLEKITSSISFEFENRESRTNRSIAPFLRSFDSWNIEAHLSKTRQVMRDFAGKIVFNNSWSVLPEFIELVYENMQPFVIINEEVDKYKREKEFSDCAAAAVHSEFRTYIISNEPANLSKMKGLKYKMMVEVALYKWTLARGLFLQRIFPFPKPDFINNTLPSSVHNNDWISTSVVREMSREIIEGFYTEFSKTFVIQLPWTRAGPREFFIWRNEEYGMEIGSMCVSVGFVFGKGTEIGLTVMPKESFHSDDAIVMRSFTVELKGRTIQEQDDLEDASGDINMNARHSGYSKFLVNKKNYTMLHKKWEWWMRLDEKDRTWESEFLEDVNISPFTTWKFWLRNRAGHNHAFNDKVVNSVLDLVMTIEWKYVGKGFNWNNEHVEKFFKAD